MVAILTKILDEPDLELRTEVAEGLCKLLMIGSINSPKLLSRLLLIWWLVVEVIIIIIMFSLPGTTP